MRLDVSPVDRHVKGISTTMARVIPSLTAAAAASLVVYQWAVARPLWLDEEMLAINLRERGLPQLAGALSLGQTAPYGWLALQRLVLDMFGSGERALRAVPMIFGLASMAIALWIGRRWLAPLGTSLLVLMTGVGQWVTYSYVEFKPYSADVCLGLWLPALAVWAIETDRVVIWWTVAAVAQFVANGATFVAPGCAALIVVSVWRRRGLRAAFRAAVPGLLFLVLFGIHYVVALRPAQASTYLQTYWQLQFPPTHTGPIAIITWFAPRLAAIAVKPGGTRIGVALWIAAVAGFVAATGRRRLLAVSFALVLLSSFALATAHVLPFFERLVLWIVPALFVGVAMLADVGRPGGLRYASTVIAILFAADVAYVGLDDLRARPAASHHRLDDRASVRWLAAHEQPGDVWVTTHLALPAIWWYAGDRRIVEVGYRESGCGDALHDQLSGATRALVYLGFRFDDVPNGFDDLLLTTLIERGRIVAFRGFGDDSRVAVVDLRLTSRRDLVPGRAGCVGAEPARRW